ncbi:hypothetical protein DAPPUDRAFT_238900 [Daphnia pulex]|uniref:Uncharacterized protein n=1 Tax=Daphnia pulex TaxID=6669 RepID=E9G7R0_DAPPU|nr:hypothetical protein DAPPUDRAFT_238900 [Daphnia pulex]|eukprot:EFX84614.1 hypothetical protein DAPPUDRAFT_238900 [Daphnia pulex]
MEILLPKVRASFQMTGENRVHQLRNEALKETMGSNVSIASAHREPGFNRSTSGYSISGVSRPHFPIVLSLRNMYSKCPI